MKRREYDNEVIRNTHKRETHVFDREQVNRTIVFLPGVGRRCIVCNKHIFGRIDKKTCSQRCRSKMRYEKTGKTQTNLIGVHAFISLKAYRDKNEEFRILKIYLKKGVTQEVKITQESKELWSLLEKIEQFRDVSKPLEIMA